MSDFINVDLDKISSKGIEYSDGDVLSIFYKHSLSGFGLRFGPILDHQAWNIRSINSAVGLDTYAPSQDFELDDVNLRLISAGNETIETQPYRDGHHLIIRAAGKGQLVVHKRDLQAYTPPQWAYDYWFSTPWTRMSDEEVLSEINTAHSHHLSPKVWLLDAGWESSDELLSFNAERFKSGNDFLVTLTEQDIKPIVWFAPYIYEKTKLWHLCDKNGWFAKDENNKSAVFPVVGNGEEFGSYLDFTSYSLLAYLAERLNSMASLGLAGIMFDFGESLPDKAILVCETEESKLARQKGLIGHNWYVGEIKRQLNKLTNSLDFCLISRSGWTDSFAYSGLWLGDQSSDTSRFAGLESLTWGYKTAHESGYKFIGMDVGGYFGVPTPADYKRWLDLSICMPFSMLHGALQANPWEEGDEMLAYFRKTRTLHKNIWNDFEKTKVSFKSDHKNQRVTNIIAGNFEFDTYSID